MSKRFFLLIIGGFGIALIITLAALGGFGFFQGGNNFADSLHIKQLAAGHSTPQPPGPPPAAQISLTIRKLKTGNSLIIQWTNLPANTAALDLFCSALKNTTTSSLTASSTWTLWKEILLSSGELSAGDREVALGVWYQRCSFYVVQAISAGKIGALGIGATTTLNFTNGPDGMGDAGTGNDDSTILWTSGITLPGVTTSTIGLPPPPVPPGSSPGQGQTGGEPDGTPSSTNPKNPGSTPQPSSTSPTSSSTGSNPIGSVPPNTPNGTPYYDPQVQIYGYAASGSPIFWVQHAGQGIEIGWQNIPPETDTIVILRSNSADGPWNAFLTEQNLPTNNYSLQVVDDSIATPYYYQMQAISGTSTIALYGPDYLAPVGQ